MFTLTDRASTLPSNIMVVYPVRGLLERKILEENLQNSNESMTARFKLVVVSIIIYLHII